MERTPQRCHRASQGKRPYSPTGRWKGLSGGSKEKEDWEETGQEGRREEGQEKREGERGGLVRQGRPGDRTHTDRN